MASDWNNNITNYNTTNSNSSIAERVRIPVVPLAVSIEDTDTKDDINNHIRDVADTREVVLDYSRGDMYIKNGSDVYNLKDRVANAVMTEYGGQIKANIGGVEVNIVDIITDLENERIYATPAIFDNRSEWVGDNGKISLSVDNKTTELVFDTSDNIYKIQIKGYDPNNPVSLSNTVPYIDNEGNLIWKNANELTLEGFDSAQDNTVPVKSGDELVWSKVTNNGSDVQFVDIDQLDAVIDNSVTEKVITHEVIYGEVVEGHNVVCLGATVINIGTILDDISALKAELKKEIINHQKDVFSLSCQVQTVSFGHNNLIIEDFKNIDTIFGDMENYITDQYTLNYYTDEDTCELSFIIEPPEGMDSGLLSCCVYYDGDSDTILSIYGGDGTLMFTTMEGGFNEDYFTKGYYSLINLDFQSSNKPFEFRLSKQGQNLNINNIAVSYNFVERG